MIRNILYAVLLGVGMAACLSRNDEAATDQPAATETSPALPTAEENAGPAPAALVIGKGRVGEVRLGMPIKEMREQAMPGITLTDTTLQQEGMASTAYLLHPQNEPQGLLVEQTCEPLCHVWRITVHGRQYKTAKGIGVGSTYGEAQQAYPISYVSPGEGNFVAVSKEAGLSFVLDQSQLPQNRLASLKPADVPPNTPITAIIVY